MDVRLHEAGQQYTSACINDFVRRDVEGRGVGGVERGNTAAFNHEVAGEDTIDRVERDDSRALYNSAVGHGIFTASREQLNGWIEQANDFCV